MAADNGGNSAHNDFALRALNQTEVFILGAMGLVAALAWNEAFTSIYKRYAKLQTVGPWVYALCITFAMLLLTWGIEASRLAREQAAEAEKREQVAGAVYYRRGVHERPGAELPPDLDAEQVRRAVAQVRRCQRFDEPIISAVWPLSRMPECADGVVRAT